jgi:hypothetical protein
MKALTLTQPWATLVAIGAKKIETRSWYTHYRGPLAIHAAKGFPKWARDFTLEPACYHAMEILGYKTRRWFPRYPLGAVIATCTLVDCVRMVEPPVPRLPISIGRYDDRLIDHPVELDFGDYSPGRFAWILKGVECFENPIPATGALGLWEWTRP